MLNAKISIDREEYEMLLDRLNKLQALEKGGVENWEWYEQAMEEYWNSQEES